jgi:hypothetical protein
MFRSDPLKLMACQRTLLALFSCFESTYGMVFIKIKTLILHAMRHAMGLLRTYGGSPNGRPDYRQEEVVFCQDDGASANRKDDAHPTCNSGIGW